MDRYFFRKSKGPINFSNFLLISFIYFSVSRFWKFYGKTFSNWYIFLASTSFWNFKNFREIKNCFFFHLPKPGILVCFAAPPPPFFEDNVCRLFPPPGTEIKSGSSKSESSSSSSGFLLAPPDFLVGLASTTSSSGSVSKSSSKLRVWTWIF